MALGYNHHPWYYISDVWIRKTQSLERLWQASRGSCNTKEEVLGEEFLFLNMSSGSVVKNPSAYAGDAGSIPGLGGSLGEVNGNPLQYSCLGNLMDRGIWCATVHGVAQSRHNKQLRTDAIYFLPCTNTPSVSHFKKIIIILAALGPCCCVQAFFSGG